MQRFIFTLEITIWDKDQRSKDDFMGRCSVDLTDLKHETTHQLWVDVKDGEGKLHLLLTITGKANSEKPIMDLDKWSDPPEVVEDRMQKFKLRHSFQVRLL